MPGFIAALLSMIPVGMLFERLQLKGPINIAIMIPFVVIGIILQSYEKRWERRLVERLGLECPKCGFRFTGLSGQIVMGTGRCGQCGEPIIEDDRFPDDA